VFRTFLSWRYLRERRTNLIGIIGILVGVGALILILSIMTGFLELSRVAARASSADVILTPYFSELGAVSPPGESGAAPRLVRHAPSTRDPAQLLESLRADPRIQAASVHLNYYGLLLADEAVAEQVLTEGTGAFVQLVGVDVDEELSTTQLGQFLAMPPLRGQRVADLAQPFALPPEAPSGRPRPVIVLGDRLMRTHGLSRGDVVKVATAVPSSTGEFESADFECVVGGSFRSRENELDVQRVYLDRDQLSRVLAGVRHPDDPLPEGSRTYSEVLLKLVDYERDRATICDSLEERLVSLGLLHPSSTIETWEEQKRIILGAIENERVLMAIMLSLVLLVAGFTIFAILSMMVTEKRRDIGVLTALGATPRGVMQMFLLIGFWDALIGASLGCLAGVVLALKIDPIERWLSRTFDVQIFNRDVYLFDYIPSQVEPVRVALIVLGAFACALLFAMIPAWRAARLDPLDALRYE
jgi:ABC-type lipoprotein release transport system permease subunit